MKLFRQTRAPVGPQGEQMLAALDRAGAMTTSELARALDVNRDVIASAGRGLLRRGLVEKGGYGKPWRLALDDAQNAVRAAKKATGED